MNEKLLKIVWKGKEKEITKVVNLSKEGMGVLVRVTLLGKKNESVRIKIQVNHLKPRTKSRVIVRGVLSGNSRADFDGMIKVVTGAKGAETWLEARLLLSEKAQGKVAPSMEISEDAVQAGHAVSIGRVSDEELFYLESRGLSKKTAVKLITEGFLKNPSINL